MQRLIYLLATAVTLSFPVLANSAAKIVPLSFFEERQGGGGYACHSYTISALVPRFTTNGNVLSASVTRLSMHIGAELTLRVQRTDAHGWTGVGMADLILKRYAPQTLLKR